MSVWIFAILLSATRKTGLFSSRHAGLGWDGLGYATEEQLHWTEDWPASAINLEESGLSEMGLIEACPRIGLICISRLLPIGLGFLINWVRLDL